MQSDQARELLQLISEGYVFVDADLCVREVNAIGLEMARRPSSEFIGQRLSDLAPGLEQSELGRLLREALDQGRPVSTEYGYTWRDGRQTCLEVRAHPTSGGLAIFFRDITEQKRSHEALDHAQAELMHASRLSAMGTMAATLAHELAQPLTSASNAIEATGRIIKGVQDPLAVEARHGLSLAGTSVKRAIEILKRLRAFVTKRPIQTGPTDLEAVIADASILVFPRAQREEVEISFRLDHAARSVDADPIQIQQVLINLITNAIDAMSESPEKRILIASAALSPQFVEVVVEDSGPGLAGKSAETLFAPFHSTKTHGLGVGLSISRTIVEAHGGHIEAEPAEGGGARFRFTLPRVNALKRRKEDG